MQIINRTHFNDEIYQRFYNYHYHYDKNTVIVRNKDAWPALCFAHDIFDISFFDDKESQLAWLLHHRRREPKSVVEIGPGNGEVSFFFWKLGADVVSIDCNPSAALFFEDTSLRFFGNADDRLKLCLGKTTAFLDQIPENIDTLVLVATIEHIIDTEWQEFFSFILPKLQNNHGRLIMTNSMWPLGGAQDPADDHISRIDDEFFNNLIRQGGMPIYRNLGKICIQY